VPDRKQGTALSDGPPRALLVVALSVAVAAVAAVLVVAVMRSRPLQGPQPERPLVIPAVPAPQANAPECAMLMGALPQRLGDYPRTRPADPAPPATAAWRSGGTEPVLLRCGVGQPADFVVGSPIQIVNTVQWFRVAEQGTGRSTWFVVDRPVYVALTLPQGAGATPIQEISDVVAARLTAVPIRPGPPR
jgi:Protein of unknown function (DUF3515)